MGRKSHGVTVTLGTKRASVIANVHKKLEDNTSYERNNTFVKVEWSGGCGSRHELGIRANCKQILVHCHVECFLISSILLCTTSS
jgi:hypothetical protein